MTYVVVHYEVIQAYDKDGHVPIFWRAILNSSSCVVREKKYTC